MAGTQNHLLKPFQNNGKDSASSKTCNQNQKPSDRGEESISVVQKSPLGSSDMDSECLSGSAAESGLTDHPANQVNSPNGQKSSKPCSSDCRSSGISSENSLSLSLNETPHSTSQDVEMLSPESPACKGSMCKDSVQGTCAEVKTSSASCGPAGPKPTETADTGAQGSVGEGGALESEAHKTNCTDSSVLNTVNNQNEDSWTNLAKRYFFYFFVAKKNVFFACP